MAANGTRHPDRFDTAARTWIAQNKIISGCARIVEQVETQAPPGRGLAVSLGLRHHLDDMRDADRNADTGAFFVALADYMEECAEIRAPGGVEDRL